MRILIADKSATYRKMFIKAIAELNSAAIVSHVSDKEKASEMIKLFDYEIVIIDAEISELHMLLKEISRHIPKAYVLVTTRPSTVSDELCSEAIAFGADGCLTKPIDSSYTENYDVVKQKVVDVFEAIAKHRSSKNSQINTKRAKTVSAGSSISFQPDLVLIAASTGGPPALEAILKNLRKDFPVPILVVQHMLPQLTETLTQNLNQKSPLTVKIAANKEIVRPSTVYVAPGGKHMKLDAAKNIILDESPPVSGLRPAADVLFGSIADSFTGAGVVVIILTGMGYDGARGLALLKEKQNCYCLAQSEQTCIVYGMPRAAVESGYADSIMDLEKIAPELESFFRA